VAARQTAKPVLDPQAPAVLVPTSTLDSAALQGVIRRVDALESALRDAPPTTVRAALHARSSDTELIKRVRDIIAQSEVRQQGQLALRLRQVINEFDAQRTADLARISTSFGQMQGSMTAEAAAHRDLANYVFSSGNKQK
jgi:plasmid stability protein